MCEFFFKIINFLVKPCVYNKKRQYSGKNDVNPNNSIKSGKMPIKHLFLLKSDLNPIKCVKSQ